MFMRKLPTLKPINLDGFERLAEFDGVSAYWSAEVDALVIVDDELKVNFSSRVWKGLDREAAQAKANELLNIS